MKKSYRTLPGGLLVIPLLLLTLTGCGGGDSTSALAALAIFRASERGSIEANNNSQSPSISSDGRYITFASDATNLLGPGGDTNGVTDIFLHDRLTHVTTRVSLATGGSQADNNSMNPAISSDGRFIAFASDATNLLGAGGDTNGFRDIFVHDRLTGITTRVNLSSFGTPADNNSQTPSISSDGRFVAFASDATNLLGIGGDTNGFKDIFVRDRGTGMTTRVSVSSAAVAGNNTSLSPSISSTGQFIAFASDASNLIGAGNDTNIARDIFVHDSLTAATTRVSLVSGGGQANSASLDPAISANGWLIVFSSSATNLIGPGADTNTAQDIFLYDRTTGLTTRLSQAADNTQANNNSQAPAISADGLFTAFSSDANNLLGAGGDTNGFRDIFVTAN